MNKKAYYLSFLVAPLLCFLLALITKFEINDGVVDFSDIAVFVVSIICGPFVGLTCGVGVALSDIVTANYSVALYSGIVASAIGFLTGFLYNKVFSSKSIIARKLLSLLCGAGIGIVLWVASSFLLCTSLSNALMMIMFRTLLCVVGGLISYFILPKEPPQLFNE